MRGGNRSKKGEQRRKSPSLTAKKISVCASPFPVSVPNFTKQNA